MCYVFYIHENKDFKYLLIHIGKIMECLPRCHICQESNAQGSWLHTDQHQ